MKNIALLTIIFSSIMLTACGGGGTDAALNSPVDPVVNNGKLVIDNGRGTMNNQDTETGK